MLLPPTLPRLRLALLLFTATVALAQPISAAPPSEMRRVQQDIMHRIKSGDYDNALAIARAFEPEHPNHAARVAYVEGLVSRAKGKHKAAARSFRHALAANPGQTQVREQLALSLIEGGDLDAARHHFDVLSTSTSDPRLRTTYDRYREIIDSQKPWRFSGYLTVAPSTNVNKGSGKDTATLFGLNGWSIPKSQQKKSGVGLSTGGYGGYDLRLDDNLWLGFAAAADARLYTDSKADALRLHGSVKPRSRFADGMIEVALGPFVTSNFTGYNLDSLELGIDSDITARLAPGLAFSLSNSYSHIDVEDNNDSDAWQTSSQFRLNKSLGAAASGSLLGGAEWNDAKAKNRDYFSAYFGVGLAAEWEGGWMAGAEARLGLRDFSGTLTGKSEGREDNFGSLTLQLSNRKIEYLGFSPVLNYTYTKQNSNDEWADYDSHDVAVTLTRNF